MNDELREADRRLEKRIEQLAEGSRVADARLGERIDALGERIDKLVSGIGEFLRERRQ